jgi:hypothetical protein
LVAAHVLEPLAAVSDGIMVPFAKEDYHYYIYQQPTNVHLRATLEMHSGPDASVVAEMYGMWDRCITIGASDLSADDGVDLGVITGDGVIVLESRTPSGTTDNQQPLPPYYVSVYYSPACRQASCLGMYFRLTLVEVQPTPTPTPTPLTTPTPTPTPTATPMPESPAPPAPEPDGHRTPAAAATTTTTLDADVHQTDLVSPPAPESQQYFGYSLTEIIIAASVVGACIVVIIVVLIVVTVLIIRKRRAVTLPRTQVNEQEDDGDDTFEL